MTSYKQWSAGLRRRRLRWYTAQRANGAIPPPGPCEICGQTEGTMHHAEDYGPDEAAYMAALHSLCARCHAMVHLRFRLPGIWAAYKQSCREFGPRPVARTMSSVFLSFNSTPDRPIQKFREGNSWWEKLKTEPYEGQLQ